MAELTSEEVNNLNSSLKDLTKLLQKNNKEFSKMDNYVDNMNSGLSDAKKTLDKIAKDPAKKISASVKELVKDISSIFNVTFFGSVTAFSAHLIKDAIKLDTVAHQVATRMAWGEGGVKKFKGAVNDLQKSFGASYEDASGLVKELSERHYVENIGETAASINLMSRATGESASNLVQFSDHLSKAAGMGSKAITATMASMTKAQQAVGLSNAGMTAVVDRVSQAAEKMKAFGKTDAEIKKMATSTVLLASSMEKVGISAGDAAALIEKLTDPDRIEDNIMLYSQLGVSMEDALSGNIDISQDQLKELGQKIADMGPIAGKQLAQSMGMSYTEAVKMSKLEAPEVDVGQVEVGEEGALEALDEMTKKTEGLEGTFNRIWNKAEGTIRSWGPLIIGLAGVILPKVIQMAAKAFTGFFKDTETQASVFTEGVGGALVNSLIKAKDKVSVEYNTLFKNLGGAIETHAGAAFGDLDKQITILQNKIKHVNFSDAFYDAGLQNYFDEIGKQINDTQAQSQQWLKVLEDAGIQTEIINGHIKDVDTTKLTLEQNKLYSAITKKQEETNALQDYLLEKKFKELGYYGDALELAKQQAKAEMEMIPLKEKIQGLEEQEKSASQELIDLSKKRTELEKIENPNEEVAAELERIIELENTRGDKLKELRTQISENKNILETQKKAQTEINDALDKEIKARENSVKKVVETNDDLKKAKDALKEMVKNGQRGTDAFKQQKAEVEKLKEKLKDAKEEAGKIAPPTSAIAKLTKGIKLKIKTAFDESGIGKAINNFKADAAKSGGGFKGFRAAAGKAIGKGAGKVGSKALGGITKGLGGIMKTLGPMAIVMTIVGKFMDKIKEPLNNMLDNVMKSLQPVLDVLLPIVSDLINVLVKSLMPPILNILSMGLKVLHFILKPIIAILRLCEHIPGIGGALKGTADALDKATGKEVQEALTKAANNIANSTEDFTEAAKDNKEEMQAAQLKVEGGKAVVASKASTAVASSQASSTTQTVTEKKSADDDAKELNNQKKDKEEKQLRNFLMGNGNKDLPKMIEDLGTQIVNAIMNALSKDFNLTPINNIGVTHEDTSASDSSAIGSS